MSAGGSFILLLIAYPLYLKYLGAEQYGVWAAISVVVFVSRLGNLGINNALIKYTAEKFGQDDFEGITSYTTTSFCILTVPSLFILLAIFLFNSQIIKLLGLKSSYAEQAQLLIPLIGILSIFILFVELIKGVLMGIERVDIANYVFLIGRIVQVGVSVSLIIAGVGIWGLYWGTTLSYVTIFVLYLYFLRYKYKTKLFSMSSFKKECMKNLLSFGGTMFSARIVSMLMEPFNKVIISRYIGLSEVAYYELALRCAGQLRSLYEMGLRAVMPKVSELQQKSLDFRKAVKSIHDKSIRFILITALPVFAGAFILSEVVLSLWIGDSYVPQMSKALRWFLIAYMANLFIVPSYYIFAGINQVRFCLCTASIRSIVNCAIVLGFILSGFAISFDLIIIVNSFAMVTASVFLLTTYYLKIDKYLVQ